MSDFFAKIQDLVKRKRVTEANGSSDEIADSVGSKNSSHAYKTGKNDNRIMEEMHEMQAIAREIQSLSIFKPADTAWDRFKDLFKSSLHGYRSMEWKATYTMAMIGSVCGFLVRRRAIATQNAVQRFKVQHNLSFFDSRRDYVVRLATFIGMNRIREDLPNCVRLAAICSMSTFTITGLASVRDRLLYTDFLVGYAMAGFLYRLQRGVRAAFATGLIGSFFGLLFIGLMQPYLLYRGQSLDQFYKDYRHEFYFKQYQKGKFNQELVDVMGRYNIGYFNGKAKVKELREQEKWRLATIRNMNTDATLNPLPEAKPVSITADNR